MWLGELSRQFRDRRPSTPRATYTIDRKQGPRHLMQSVNYSIAHYYSWQSAKCRAMFSLSYLYFIYFKWICYGFGFCYIRVGWFHDKYWHTRVQWSDVNVCACPVVSLCGTMFTVWANNRRQKDLWELSSILWTMFHLCLVDEETC